jgi:hypothetical protein
MAVARALVSSDEDVLEASTPHAVGQGGADEGRLWAPEMRAHTKEAFGAAPQFLMLDFRRAAILRRVCCIRQWCQVKVQRCMSLSDAMELRAV